MQDTLAFQISVLYRDFLSFTTRELKKLGLSFGQMPVIIYTGKHPGCTHAELTKALKLDWGYSQRCISKLTATGFIKKEYQEDGACHCLNLTAQGATAFEMCHGVFASWDQMNLTDFSEEEKAVLLSLLNKITIHKRMERP